MNLDPKNPRPRELTSRTLKAINRFEEAIRVHEMLGAKHPQDHEAIIQELKASKAELKDSIRKAMNP